MDIEPASLLTPAVALAAQPAPNSQPFDLATLAADGECDGTATVVEQPESGAPTAQTDISFTQGIPMPDTGTLLPVEVLPAAPSPPQLPATLPAVATKSLGINAAPGQSAGTLPRQNPLAKAQPVPSRTSPAIVMARSDQPDEEAETGVISAGLQPAPLDEHVVLPVSQLSGETVPTPAPISHFRMVSLNLARPEPAQLAQPRPAQGLQDDFRIEANAVDQAMISLHIESQSARLIDALSLALPGVSQTWMEQGVTLGSISVGVSDRGPGSRHWEPVRGRPTPHGIARANHIHRNMRFTAYA